MNYGVSGATIIPGAKYQSFYEDCRYEQLQKSLPNFVFFSFGSTDQHLKNFTEQKFVDSYIKLIKETQDLPSKPMVFLMTPVFNCQHNLNLTASSSEKLSDFTINTNECNDE